MSITSSTLVSIYSFVFSLLYPFDVGNCQAFAQETCIIITISYLYFLFLFLPCPCRWCWIIGPDKNWSGVRRMDRLAGRESRMFSRGMRGSAGWDGTRQSIGLKIPFPSVGFDSKCRCFFFFFLFFFFFFFLHRWQTS